jgi:hypothetical protein
MKYELVPAVILPVDENSPAVDTFPVVSMANALANTLVLLPSRILI